MSITYLDVTCAESGLVPPFPQKPSMEMSEYDVEKHYVYMTRKKENIKKEERKGKTRRKRRRKDVQREIRI